MVGGVAVDSYDKNSSRRRYQLEGVNLQRLNDLPFDFDNGRCLNVNDEYVMMCSPLSNFHRLVFEPFLVSTWLFFENCSKLLVLQCDI